MIGRPTLFFRSPVWAKQCLGAAPAHHPPGLVPGHAEPAPGPLPPSVPGSESVLALREAVHAHSAPFFLDVCAGAGAPLSTALRQLGVSTLAIDPLLDSRMDLRDDAFFDHLLRICPSKSVALAHAAPPCGEYTRAKLLRPRALRTPEALNGIPGLGPADALKVQESHLVFTRCVQLLFVTFSCGGQVSLEQPTNSMAWLEPLASHFLREIQADLVNVAACSVGLNLHKSWLFATCFRPLQALASVCEHPRGSHGDIRGTRDSSGGFLSRASAEYPDTLAQRYAQQVKTLFPVSASGSRMSLDSAPLPSRLKTLLEPPVSAQDGAGIFSVPDWSVPPPETLRALVEEELDKGWLLELDSLASAQARFGSKLAIGKMSIVSAPGKKPRLVVDSTVCGTNPSCFIPETFALPSVDDVRECFPLRMHDGKLAGFALDVKSAHKTARVRPADQGLLGVTLPSADGFGTRYLFYQVCPFGANFSALWFQRLGSFFLRILHLWIWLRHALLGYVDDFLLVQDEDVIALFSCHVLAFCTMFGIPISYAKLRPCRAVAWVVPLVWRASPMNAWLPDWMAFLHPRRTPGLPVAALLPLTHRTDRIAHCHRGVHRRRYSLPNTAVAVHTGFPNLSSAHFITHFLTLLGVLHEDLIMSVSIMVLNHVRMCNPIRPRKPRLCKISST